MLQVSRVFCITAKMRADVADGSKCEELRVSKSSPLRPTKRASMRGVVTSLMGQARKSLDHSTGSRRQLVEQRLGLFQIERVEPFSEPAVNRSQQITCRGAFALIAP